MELQRYWCDIDLFSLDAYEEHNIVTFCDETDEEVVTLYQFEHGWLDEENIKAAQKTKFCIPIKVLSSRFIDPDALVFKDYILPYERCYHVEYNVKTFLEMLVRSHDVTMDRYLVNSEDDVVEMLSQNKIQISKLHKYYSLLIDIIMETPIQKFIIKNV